MPRQIKPFEAYGITRTPMGVIHILPVGQQSVLCRNKSQSLGTWTQPSVSLKWDKVSSVVNCEECAKEHIRYIRQQRIDAHNAYRRRVRKDRNWK